jgi:DMSO/TMAO reductase YedYZ molybdopterin-dependent catalytic subunit
MRALLFSLLMLTLFSACSTIPGGECNPPEISMPTPPAVIPGYTELDPTTGLHVTGTMQMLDLATYRLRVTGKVDNPLDLSYNDLRCMPKMESLATIICRGNFEDSARWTGTSLAHILNLAQIQPEATQIILRGADGYSATVKLSDALNEYNMLAYQVNGQILPPLHGFPVRAAFPALMGYTWVKWLIEIEVN